MNSEFRTHHHDFPGGFRRGGAVRGPGTGGPGFGPSGHFGGFGPRGFGPGGPPRKRRGDVRAAILSRLVEGGSNGYGLIKQIGERSGGSWHPSPGSVYPTLQQLVDEELIEPVGEGKRTEFVLTEAGRAWADEHADELSRVWDGSEERAHADAGLHSSVGALMGVVQQFRFTATEEQRAKAVEKLDETRRALYGILAE